MSTAHEDLCTCMIVQSDQKVCAPNDYNTVHQAHREFFITMY